jgi:hypothetical protein
MPNDDYMEDSYDQDPRVATDERAESKDEEMEQPTGLLPKSFFTRGVPKVGDTERIKITGVFEDEVEAVCVYGGGDKKEDLGNADEADVLEME